MNFMLLTKMVNVFIGPASPKKSFCHCFTTGLVAALAFHRALSTGEHAVQVFLISLGQCENFIGSPPTKKKKKIVPQIIGILIFLLGKKLPMHVHFGGFTVTPLSICIFLNFSFKARLTGILIFSKFF